MISHSLGAWVERAAGGDGPDHKPARCIQKFALTSPRSFFRGILRAERGVLKHLCFHSSVFVLVVALLLLQHHHHIGGVLYFIENRKRGDSHLLFFAVHASGWWEAVRERHPHGGHFTNPSPESPLNICDRFPPRFPPVPGRSREPPAAVRYFKEVRTYLWRSRQT